ncbi:hypothetical protein AOLI_G00187930 [Acnodon oligacanthus]
MDALKKYTQPVYGSSPSSYSVLPPGSLPRPGPSRKQSPQALEPADDELMACALEEPNCHRAGQLLTSSGLYKTVKRVLNKEGDQEAGWSCSEDSSRGDQCGQQGVHIVGSLLPARPTVSLETKTQGGSSLMAVEYGTRSPTRLGHLPSRRSLARTRRVYGGEAVRGSVLATAAHILKLDRYRED